MSEEQLNQEKEVYNDLADVLVDGAFIFLTGAAGTGKSYTLKKVVERFKEQGVPYEISSSTGSSAVLVNGQTIHRVLGTGISNSIKDIPFLKDNFIFKKRQKELAKLRVLIIDEVSMLSGDFLDLADYVLRKAKRKLDVPFGGIGILLTGDFLQIKPVLKRSDDIQNGFAFKSEVWRSFPPTMIHLTKIHRQDNREFINYLLNVREGKVNSKLIDFLNSRNFNPREIDNIDAVRLVGTREEAKQINEKRLAENENKEFEINGKPTGDYTEKEMNDFINDLIVEETYKIKVGCRVMTLCNRENDEAVFQNGSTGKVIEISKNGVLVEFDSGNTYLVTENEWKREVHSFVDSGYKREDGSVIYDKVTREYGYKQIPLALAYALTIHKSQGMTIDKIIVGCKRIFDENMFGVAISRVKSPEGLYLTDFNPGVIKVNRECLSFYTERDE